MVLCCKCNKTGRCRNCACVKAGIQCQNCLPSRLGNCSNRQPLLSEEGRATARQPPLSETLLLEDDSEEEDPIMREDCHIDSQQITLPVFTPLQEPNFSWGTTNGIELTNQMDQAYEQIILWKRNLFLVPSGKAGKDFVAEVARLYNAYADASPLECIALKSVSVMQALLLQKPYAKSKSKDHMLHLSRRLSLWKNGCIYTETLREHRKETGR